MVEKTYLGRDGKMKNRRMTTWLAVLAFVMLVGLSAVKADPNDKPPLELDKSVFEEIVSSTATVAIHISEATRTHWNNLGGPHNDWQHWHIYGFLMEQLRSDGTPFDVVLDADIHTGALMNEGELRYAIVFSLANDCISDDVAAKIEDFVSAGGHVFVGSTSWTRNENGVLRGTQPIEGKYDWTLINAGADNWFGPSFLPINTIDDNPDNQWLNHIDDILPTSIWWQFPAVETISKIGIWQTDYAPDWSYRIKEYEISTSTNGTDWTPVATNTGTNIPGDYQETSFEPIGASYVRITAYYPSWEDGVFQDYNTANWIGLNGFQAYDSDGMPLVNSPPLLNPSSNNYFAISDAMGLIPSEPILIGDIRRTGVSHPLVTHLENDTVVRGWKLARRASDSGYNHPLHWAQGVIPTTATVLAESENGVPILTVRNYGKGKFIYHSEFNPLAGYSMHTVANYVYGFYRKAIDEAHKALSMPNIRLGAWPWPYVAGFMTRHDHFSNFGFDGISGTEDDALVAEIEASRGVQGGHFLRTNAALPTGHDMCFDPTYGNNCVEAVQNNILAMVALGAQFGTHTTDESMEPSQANITASLDRLESYLDFRPVIFVAPGGAGFRDTTKQGLFNNGILVKGDSALGAHPTFALKIDTATEYNNDARWPMVELPATGYYGTPNSGAFAGGIWAHEITSNPSTCNNDGTIRPCMEKAVDLQYNLGGLICLYDHIGDNSLANPNPTQFAAYIDYAQSKPYVYTTNPLDLYGWWIDRDPISLTMTHDPARITINLARPFYSSEAYSLEVDLPWDSNLNFVVMVDDILTENYVLEVNRLRIKTHAPSVVVICVDQSGDGFCDNALCSQPILGDLNNDCKVDLADLAMFVSNWLRCNLEPQSECWD